MGADAVFPQKNNEQSYAEMDSITKNGMDFHQYKILAIIPAYNESRFIGSVVLKLKTLPVEILVVDDGSTDDTADIARAAGADVLRLETNQGKGTALNAGLVKASQAHPDAIVLIDADGQHLPDELFQVVRPILEKKADIAIGSRYLSNTSNTPLTGNLDIKY